MEKKRMFILVVAVAGMIGTFLPWASAFGFSVSGTEGDGWITLGLFAIGGAIVLFAGNRAEALSKGKLAGVWITAALAALIALHKIFTKDPIITIGIGLYLIAIAGIAQILLAFFFKGGEAAEVPAAPSPGIAPPPEPAQDPPAEDGV